MIFLTNEEDLNIENITCLYFYKSNMPFYNKAKEIIENIEKNNSQIKYLAIDVDYFKILCKRFNIISAPLIVIFQNKIEINRISVLKSKQEIEQIFNNIGE